MRILSILSFLLLSGSFSRVDASQASSAFLSEALAARSAVGDTTLSRHTRLQIHQEIPFPLPGSGVKGQSPQQPSDTLLIEAQKVRDFLAERQSLPLDVLDPPAVLVLFGSNMLAVAREAGELILSGVLQVSDIVIAGGKGRFTPVGWDSEAEEFEKVLRAMGIQLPIHLDPKSSNSGENATFSYEIIKTLGAGRPIVLMQWSMHQRRAAATLRKVVGDAVRVISCAPFIPDFHRPAEGFTQAEWYRWLLLDVVGEPFRLVEYQKPEHGFFDPLPVPLAVVEAAIRVGEFLQGDRSIPEDYQAVLHRQLASLRKAA